MDLSRLLAYRCWSWAAHSSLSLFCLLIFLALAYVDPIFHMNEALKGVSALGKGAGDISTHLIFLGAFTVFALFLGVRSYRSMLIQEKKG